MSFNVTADAYGQFIGRFSAPLSTEFVIRAGLADVRRVLDVGSGPGALTTVLVERFGAAAVSAVDPSAPFVEAMRGRFPDVDVRSASAEALPYPDDTFDATLAQLVVHFMADPVAGLREMGRVTRAGGVVAACVWDHAGGGSPLNLFWEVVSDIDPNAEDESQLAGAREGHLAELAEAAGLSDITSSLLTVTVTFQTLDEWWQPYTFGVGPAGAYVAGLSEAQRVELRGRCSERLGPAPFTVAGSAWCLTARA